jgi:putative RNA 2'-phosphotransferase
LTDPKGRYQIDGGMIRATYGHTIDVRLDDLPPAEIDAFFYPVTEEEIDIILEGGLNPIDRKYVHLSGSIEKAVEAGKVRTQDPLILRIDGAKTKEDNVMIYHAGKDVYVTERIDAKYISKVEDQSVVEPPVPVEEQPLVEEQPIVKEKPKKRKSTKKTKKSEEKD